MTRLKRRLRQIEAQALKMTLAPGFPSNCDDAMLFDHLRANNNRPNRIRRPLPEIDRK